MLKSIDDCRQEIFRRLWKHYNIHVPFAAKIETALKARGDQWIEDHVAFRTLPGSHTGSHILQGIFELLGYKRMEDYHFAEKKLNAFWLCPPDTHSSCAKASPKVFVSELIASEFNPSFSAIIARYSAQVIASPVNYFKGLQKAFLSGDAAAGEQFVRAVTAFLSSRPPWSIPSRADYEKLREESDYAAWTLVYGNQINHFTLSVHTMSSFNDIASLGDFIESELGIAMNRSGGLVKGTSGVKLEQISTMASVREEVFQEDLGCQPYAFVEFALRYPLDGNTADGMWGSYYQGFVTENADKIFESTDDRSSKT